MKNTTAVIIVIVAVMLTSAIWFVTLNYQNYQNTPSQGNVNPNSSPTPTFTAYPTPTPTPYPTPSPTPTPVTPIRGTTTPSIPGFTLQYVDRSYEVPPTYKTDPYTGQTVIDQHGYHQDNRTIDVIITNPPFTPSTLADGNVTALFYNVRTKGHFEDWTTDTAYNHGVQTIPYSASGITVISFYIGGWGINPSGFNSTFAPQVDFQVQALVGYEHNDPNQCMGYHFYTIGKSDWSSTQTITIGTEPSPSP